MIQDIRDAMMDLASFGMLAAVFAGRMATGDPHVALVVVALFSAMWSWRLT